MGFNSCDILSTSVSGFFWRYPITWVMASSTLCAAFHCLFVNILGVSITSVASNALTANGLQLTYNSVTDNDLVCSKQELTIALMALGSRVAISDSFQGILERASPLTLLLPLL